MMGNEENSFLVLLFTLILIFVVQKIFVRFLRFTPRKSFVATIITENANYIRLLTCFNHAGTEACLRIMFQFGMPNNKIQLYNALKVFKSKFLELRKNGKMSKDQYDILFPSTGETDYTKFDVSLMYQIIRYCSSIPKPQGGWKRPTPVPGDISMAAFVIKLKSFRNMLAHYGHQQMDDAEFERLWLNLMGILRGLNYNTGQLTDLKSCPLDGSHGYEVALMKAQIDLCFDRLNERKQIDKQLLDIETQNKNRDTSLQQLQNDYVDISKKHEVAEKETDKIKNDLNCLMKQENVNKQHLQQVYNKISSFDTNIKRETEKIQQRLDNMDVSKRGISDDDVEFRWYGKTSSRDVFSAQPPDAMTSNMAPSKSYYMKEISLSNNIISVEEDFYSLRYKICQSKSFFLDQLTLCRCELTDQHIKHIAHLAPHLCKLDLSDNKAITANGWKCLAYTISTSQEHCLETLQVRDCNLVDEHLTVMSSMIPRLKNIDLSRNKDVSPYGYKFLSNTLTESSPMLLESLSLSDCNLDDERIFVLADLFMCIKDVDISRNTNISPKGFEKLSDCLKASPQTKLENLIVTGLNDEKLKKISALIPHQRSLFIHDKPAITFKGWKYLSDVAVQMACTKLESLMLYQISLNEDDVIALTPLILKLKTFVVMQSEFSSSGLAYLVDKILNKNKLRLSRIDFGECRLTLQSYMLLLRVLRKRISVAIENAFSLPTAEVRTLLEVAESTPHTFPSVIRIPRHVGVNDSLIETLASKLSLIQSLTVSRNSQIGIDSLQHLEKALIERQPSFFDKLEISYCNLVDCQTEVLARMSPFLVALNLDGSILRSPSTCGKLSENVARHNVFLLQNLSLAECNLNDSHIQALSGVIPVVKEINLSNNPGITTTGWKYFSDALNHSTQTLLQRVVIKACNLTDRGFAEISKSFKFLLYVDIKDNKTIEASSQGYFAGTTSSQGYFAGTTSCLTELVMARCNLVDAFLRKSCIFLCKLQKINFEYNTRLSVECLKIFGDTICDTSICNIKEIKFGYCNFDDRHIMAFSRALALVPTVNLSGNKLVTAVGWNNLSNTCADEAHFFMQDLYLENCDMNSDKIFAMADLIPCLRVLNLKSNKSLEIEDIAVLTNIIISREFIRLKTLNLENCNLADAHLKELAQAVPFLEELNIIRNYNVTIEGLQNMKDIIENSEMNGPMKIVCTFRHHQIDSFHFAASSQSTTWMAEDDDLTNVVAEDFVDADPRHCAKYVIARTRLSDCQLEKISSLFSYASCVTLRGENHITSAGLTSICKAVIESPLRRLSDLFVAKMNLTDVDLQTLASLTPRLRKIDLSDNKLLTPAGMEKFSSTVLEAEDFLLEDVSFSNCNLKDEHMLALQTLILNVRKVDISKNKFVNAKTWEIIGEHQKQEEIYVIECLNLQDCNLTRSHLQAIRSVFLNVKNIDLSNNFTLTPADYTFLASIMSDSKQNSLETITIHHQLQLSDFHVQGICNIFPSLKTVNFSGLKSLTRYSLKALSKVANNARVGYMKNLNLSSMNLQNDDLRYVGEMANTFRSINLSGNNEITNDGYQHFAKNFRHIADDKSVVLDTLILQNMSISESSFKSLHFLLYQIKDLDISHTVLSTTGLEHLSATLNPGTLTLQRLNLTDSHLTREHLMALEGIIPYLKHLVLNKNPLLQPSDYFYLSNLVCSTNPKNLQSVSLESCNIGDPHLQALHDLFTQMKSLDLSYNRKITTKGYRELANYLCGANKINLEFLSLKGCKLTKNRLTPIASFLLTLKQINLDNNPEITFDVFENTEMENEASISLDAISLGQCLLTDPIMKTLSPLIPSIKKMDLSNQPFLTESSMSYLVSATEATESCRLENLKLKGWNLTHSIFKPISSFVHQLKKVDFSDCLSLSPEGLQLLADKCVQSDKSNLECLKLQRTNIRSEHIMALKVLIPRLVKLDISFNKRMSTDVLVSLRKVLEDGTGESLNSLIVKDSNILLGHCKELKGILPLIKKLVLDENKRLTPDSLKELCNDEKIIEPERFLLEQISFQNCRLTLRHLLALLPLLMNVKSVDLSYNKEIFMSGLKCLSDKLRETGKTKLDTITLRDCTVNGVDFDVFKGIIENVSCLDLENNRKISTKNLKSLATIITSSSSGHLKSVSFRDCNFRDSHLNVLLAITTTLTEVDFSKNHGISVEGIRSFTNFIANQPANCRLETLNLSDCNLTDDCIKSLSKIIHLFVTVKLDKNKLISSTAMDSLANKLSMVDESRLQCLSFAKCNFGNRKLGSIFAMVTKVKEVIFNGNRSITTNGLRDALEGLEATVSTIELNSPVQLSFKNCGVQIDCKKWEHIANIIT